MMRCIFIWLGYHIDYKNRIFAGVSHHTFPTTLKFPLVMTKKMKRIHCDCSVESRFGTLERRLSNQRTLLSRFLNQISFVIRSTSIKLTSPLNCIWRRFYEYSHVSPTIDFYIPSLLFKFTFVHLPCCIHKEWIQPRYRPGGAQRVPGS